LLGPEHRVTARASSPIKRVGSSCLAPPPWLPAVFCLQRCPRLHKLILHAVAGAGGGGKSQDEAGERIEPAVIRRFKLNLLGERKVEGS